MILVSLYKKESKLDCENVRGIYLLSTVEKVFYRINLNWLIGAIFNNILPESQCGFRADRVRVDIIFSALQLQEKYKNKTLHYISFIDCSKAFDTMNRSTL